MDHNCPIKIKWMDYVDCRAVLSSVTVRNGLSLSTSQQLVLTMASQGNFYAMCFTI